MITERNAQGVDVLAVMDRSARMHWSRQENADAEDMEAARAAAAELIAADKALDAANRSLATTDPQSEDAETMEAMYAHRNRMIARRRKALAACGGAP